MSRAAFDRILGAGLGLVIVLAPLPFGAVGRHGRLGLELAALVLGLVWLARGLRHGVPRPPWIFGVGLCGLLVLTAIQLAPLGEPAVGRLSPRAAEIHARTHPPIAVTEAERRLLDVDTTGFDRRASLSLDPGATASSLRTGLAATTLLLVAMVVASTRWSLLAFALLLSAGLQGLYGILVLASGHERIWHLAKTAYLDSATGTFVNRNHFACMLAMALPCGLALILKRIRRSAEGRDDAQSRLVRWFGPEESRTMVLFLPLLTGLAGLLTSFSRTGIAIGLFALGLTLAAAGRSSRIRTRFVIASMLLAAALVPLTQLGADRLVERYSESTANLTAASGRGQVWLDSWNMATEFPAFGAGFGTFAVVYPQFRSPEVRLYYAHAHNDFLQVAAEGGALGLGFGLLLLIPVARRTARGVAGRHGILGVGVAAGLVAILLHSLVDFNLHIPSNLAIAAILVGGLFGLPCKNAD